jgi:hypothetical protein
MVLPTLPRFGLYVQNNMNVEYFCPNQCCHDAHNCCQHVIHHMCQIIKLIIETHAYSYFFMKDIN